MFMTLMYNPEAYHTRGSLRHVVGWTQMSRADVFQRITINDYWASILENWADTVKEYKRECESKKVAITVCLPKISKYFWRMLDAMFAAYNKLTPTLQSGIIIEFCIFFFLTCHTMPYHTMPCHATPHDTPRHDTTPQHNTTHHTILYHTIPYRTVTYHTIPHHTTPHHTNNIVRTQVSWW